MAVDPRWRENQEVARAAAGSANELVPALAKIITTDHWREFEHPMRGVLKFETFSEYCEQFLQIKPEAVEALLAKSERKEEARKVRRLLWEAISDDLPRDGEMGRGINRISDTKPIEQPDTTYVLARLKRDDPALARQVIDGEITANAAAVQAGIRRPYLRVRADDVRLAVAKLLEHYSADEIRKALGGL